MSTNTYPAYVYTRRALRRYICSVNSFFATNDHAELQLQNSNGKGLHYVIYRASVLPAVVQFLPIMPLIMLELYQRGQEYKLVQGSFYTVFSPLSQLPYCTEDKTISVACLKLHYYVTVSVRAYLKDETKEMHSPQALTGHEPEEASGRDSNAPIQIKSK